MALHFALYFSDKIGLFFNNLKLKKVNNGPSFGHRMALTKISQQKNNICMPARKPLINNF
jgi:hypothetical protein